VIEEITLHLRLLAHEWLDRFATPLRVSGLVHYPVVIAPRGDQPGVVDAGVRLAGTRAKHDHPAMPLMHERYTRVTPS